MPASALGEEAEELEAPELAELEAAELAPEALIWPVKGGQICAHEPVQVAEVAESFTFA